MASISPLMNLKGKHSRSFSTKILAEFSYMHVVLYVCALRCPYLKKEIFVVPADHIKKIKK